MSDGATVIYLHDGSVDGLLTAVFEAYAGKRRVEGITGDPEIQTGFGVEVIPVAADDRKARRVERGIAAKIGGMALHNIWTGFWSGDPGKDTILYRYIVAGFEQGRAVYHNLAHPDVLALEYLLRNVTREEQRVKGFVRFTRMENGVYYARIEPQNNLVPLMMPHFADRYNDMPFLIHDPVHKVAGVYDGAGWYLVEGEELTLPAVGEEEHEFRWMWRTFCDTIAVEGRINPRQQRTMMPKQYWKHLPEMMPRYAPGQYRSKKAVMTAPEREDQAPLPLRAEGTDKRG